MAMSKIKGLQMWCKNMVDGYPDVEIRDMTKSWRDGLAFCALLHKFRPDIIDFDSLSKENVYENNKLAFEVAERELGIPALLEAADMVALKVPDRLSIITYVAQYNNYFRDKPIIGGVGVKVPVKSTVSGVKRHQTVEPSPPPQVKRLAPAQQNTQAPTGPTKITHVTSMGDNCDVCDKKVYILERHIERGKLYHRSCFRRCELSPTRKIYADPATLFNRPDDNDSKSVSNHVVRKLSGDTPKHHPPSNWTKTPSDDHHTPIVPAFRGTKPAVFSATVHPPTPEVSAPSASKIVQNKPTVIVNDRNVPPKQYIPSTEPSPRPAPRRDFGSDSTAPSTLKSTKVESNKAEAFPRKFNSALTNINQNQDSVPMPTPRQNVTVKTECVSNNVPVPRPRHSRDETISPTSLSSSDSDAPPALPLNPPPTTVSTWKTPARDAKPVTKVIPSISHAGPSSSASSNSAASRLGVAKPSSALNFSSNSSPQPMDIDEPPTTTFVVPPRPKQIHSQEQQDTQVLGGLLKSLADVREQRSPPQPVTNSSSDKVTNDHGAINSSSAPNMTNNLHVKEPRTKFTQPSNVTTTNTQDQRTKFSQPSKVDATNTHDQRTKFTKPSKVDNTNTQDLRTKFTQPSKVDNTNTKDQRTKFTQPSNVTTTNTQDQRTKFSQPSKVDTTNTQDLRTKSTQPSKIDATNTQDLRTKFTQPSNVTTPNTHDQRTKFTQPSKIDTTNTHDVRTKFTQPSNVVTPRDKSKQSSDNPVINVNSKRPEPRPRTSKTTDDLPEWQKTVLRKNDSNENKRPRPKSSGVDLDIDETGANHVPTNRVQMNLNVGPTKPHMDETYDKLQRNIHKPPQERQNRSAQPAKTATTIAPARNLSPEKPSRISPQVIASSSAPDWQTEAQNRIALRDGHYVDPEKAKVIEMKEANAKAGKTKPTMVVGVVKDTANETKDNRTVPTRPKVLETKVTYEKKTPDISAVSIRAGTPKRPAPPRPGTGPFTPTTTGSTPMQSTTKPRKVLNPTSAGVPRSSPPRYLKKLSPKVTQETSSDTSSDYDTADSCSPGTPSPTRQLLSPLTPAYHLARELPGPPRQVQTRQLPSVPQRPHDVPSSPLSRGGKYNKLFAPHRPPPPQISARRLSGVEIQRSLIDIDAKLTELEIKGRQLEVAIRSGGEDEDGLMGDWFELINDKNDLIREEADLIYEAREQELEHQQNEIELQLRQLMTKTDGERNHDDEQEEGYLLEQLLKVVDMRSRIVDSIDEDKHRYEEEDKNIEIMMVKKGLKKDVKESKLI